MPQEIVIALITSATSLAVSLVGIYIATVKIRESSKQKFRDELFRKSVSGLDSAIQLVQSFRNTVYILLSSGDRTITSVDAIRRLSEKIEEVLSVSEQIRAALTPEEWKEFHFVKNELLGLGKALTEEFKEVEHVSEIGGEKRNKFLFLHAEMANLEIMLQKQKNDRIVDLL